MTGSSHFDGGTATDVCGLVADVARAAVDGVPAPSGALSVGPSRRFDWRKRMGIIGVRDVELRSVLPCDDDDFRAVQLGLLDLLIKWAVNPAQLGGKGVQRESL
jgi:hypothetical protein